ncbi:MAG: branched-chain amino acid ABC transporter permease [Betaproteobacteria bacterium]|jgi:branched-chain amino acid transport system permease protein|nr:branched-chain amino acid ABC transporter permease [Burkholderiales bacterium]NBT55132.1 branched-chain amino acid ABC transporter permease [Betaproteobacteria bacterium]
MIAQQVLNGLVLGGVYALFALGFTLIFGIHRIMNMAHGAVFMSGAFIGLFMVRIGLPIWAALPIAMAGAGFISIFVEVIAFKPLRKLALADAELASVISSIGAGLIILSVGQYVSKTQTMRFPFGTVPVDAIVVFDLRVTMLQLLMLSVAVVMVALLAYYLYRTPQGRQIRAVAGNYRAAQLLGVNPNAIFYQTFFLSGALAGAAGVMVGLAFNAVQFLMGEPFLLKAFVAIILGGLGSVPGALIGGLVLGLLQSLSGAYLPALLVDAVIFLLLFVILMVRPDGLFAQSVTESPTKRV